MLASNYANLPLIDSLTSMFNLNQFLVWKRIRYIQTLDLLWALEALLEESKDQWGFTITSCTKWTNKDILKAFQMKRQENVFEHIPQSGLVRLCRCCKEMTQQFDKWKAFSKNNKTRRKDCVRLPWRTEIYLKSSLKWMNCINTA